MTIIVIVRRRGKETDGAPLRHNSAVYKKGGKILYIDEGSFFFFLLLLLYPRKRRYVLCVFINIDKPSPEEE